MAHAIPATTWENGFRQLSTGEPWVWKPEDGDEKAYTTPPSSELMTSAGQNEYGVNVMRTWPTIYDGTNNPHGTPDWWKPEEKVDVLIVGAGPSGLEVAISLIRQGLTFRIIDKNEQPLIAGRADGVQPRFLETVAMWGLADEITEEGPLIERTAIYKDGRKLVWHRSHQSDSRYRGLHIITQGQIERVYLRDLLRNKRIVERSTELTTYKIDSAQTGSDVYPVKATLKSMKTGQESQIQAKFLVGSDGATSSIRKSLNIPFDGASTDIYWGIIDCIYDTNYPHAWAFGSVINSTHGGCVIIPRENGYIRLYAQLDVSQSGPIASARATHQGDLGESGGSIPIHSITPEEVLAQANRVFDPFYVKFAAPLSWFTIWKISERVARTYGSEDSRVQLVGDAAHVHSVMGAFGLNASILDAANLGWKIGYAARGLAKIETLLPTYTTERRKHAVRIIRVSGGYLRFVCRSELPVTNLYDEEEELEEEAKVRSVVPMGDGYMFKGEVAHVEDRDPTKEGANGDSNAKPNGTNGETKKNSDAKDIGTRGVAAPKGTFALKDDQGNVTEVINLEDVPADEERTERAWARDVNFLDQFFNHDGNFLLGVDCSYNLSCLNPPAIQRGSSSKWKYAPVKVRNGVRAPNPRVCWKTGETGYLYDKMSGAPRFHITIFASNLAGEEVRRQLIKFGEALNDPNGFYRKYGGANLINLILVTKMMPFEFEELLEKKLGFVEPLVNCGAHVAFDDRAPDEDAHFAWGVNHTTGGVAVIRPDLWNGISCYPDEAEEITKYFDGFMIPQNV